MAAAICVVLLLIVGFGRGSSERSTRCLESCVSKIPDEPQLCNDTCLQLLNLYLASNITTNITVSPPPPDKPVLLSSGYFTFTLDWSSYRETKYNASPVVYVLEVTRHENVTDPFIILPFIQKYHTTTNTSFTIPEEFVTKTNFSFRLAAVALQGTSNFSSPSPLYTTNSSCERTKNFYNESLLNPCPVFNVRVSFRVSPIQFERPNISTVIHWDLPHDVHTHLEEEFIKLEIILLPEPPQHCYPFLGYHSTETYPEHPATSYDEPLPLDYGFYFGCSYEVKLFLDFVDTFIALTTFNIPNCIHGFCSCEKSPIQSLESKYIDARVKESGINRTTVNVTWSIQAWKKQPAFFKLAMLECVHGSCPPIIGQRREIIQADGMNTTYSFTFPNLTKDEKHQVVVSIEEIHSRVKPPAI